MLFSNVFIRHLGLFSNTNYVDIFGMVGINVVRRYIMMLFTSKR